MKRLTVTEEVGIFDANALTMFKNNGWEIVQRKARKQKGGKI